MSCYFLDLLDVSIKLVGCVTGIKAAVILEEILIKLVLCLLGSCCLSARLMVVINIGVTPVDVSGNARCVVYFAVLIESIIVINLGKNLCYTLAEGLKIVFEIAFCINGNNFLGIFKKLVTFYVGKLGVCSANGI